MILGLSVGAFTAVHVLISLVAILTGLIVLFGMLRSANWPALTAIFLATTVLTSATGFLFHSKAFGPPHAVGGLSLILLAVALIALYGRGLAGLWRPVYVGCAVASLYFNVFVLVVQAFGKIAALKVLAPTQTEPPFVLAQGATLILFVVLGVFAVRRFRTV